jgi:hypothetical protein
MNHPLAALFGEERVGPEDEAHALTEEAQRANLESAWAHYSAVKTFRPGEVVRQRVGLGIVKKATVFLYVRPLNVCERADEMQIADAVGRSRFNKVDCMIGFVADDGQVIFTPMDSDLLEPLEGKPE